MENADFEFYSYLDTETLELFRKMVAVQEPGTDVQVRFHFGTGYDYDNPDDDDWELNINDGGDKYYYAGYTLKEVCDKYFAERMKIGK